MAERLVALDAAMDPGDRLPEPFRDEVEHLVGEYADPIVTTALVTEAPGAVAAAAEAMNPTVVLGVTPGTIAIDFDGNTGPEFNPYPASFPDLVGNPFISAAPGVEVEVTDIDSLNAAMAIANTSKRHLTLPGSRYKINVPFDVAKKVHLSGEGPERTVIIPAAGINGVNGNTGAGQSQYGSLSGFSVEYAAQATRATTASAGVNLPGGYMFGKIFNILVKNGYYGFRTVPVEWDSNITWDTLRATDCWIPFAFDGGGSGSVYLNLFTTNISRSSILRFMSLGNFGGEFTRVNLEHSTVRDCAIRLTLADNPSFRALHMEADSFMGRGTTPLDGALANCVIRTSGSGVLQIDQWSMNTCHIGGMMVVPFGLTRTGTTARATLHLMGLTQKTTGGHGFEVGDAIFIEGADTTTSNGYNGAQTVTAVGPDWVEFTVAGTPATPADIATGADCVTVSLGNQLLSAYHLFLGEGAAGKVRVRSMHLRDMRIIGATASRRQNLLRVANTGTSPMDVQIDDISFASERNVHAFWREQRKIIGVSRASNVTTFYFDRPHGLHLNSTIHVYNMADASFNGVFTTFTPAGKYAVKVANTGTDQALIATTVGNVILRTFQLASVERTANYATITTAADHNLLLPYESGAGLRVVIRADNTAYNTLDALILNVISSTKFLVRNVGADQALTADAGSVMLMSGGLATGPLDEGSQMAGVIKVGDLDDYQAVLVPGAVAAGGTYTKAITVQRADTLKDVAQVVAVGSRDGRLNYFAEVTAANQVTFTVANPTAGAITPTNTAVRFKVVRS